MFFLLLFFIGISFCKETSSDNFTFSFMQKDNLLFVKKCVEKPNGQIDCLIDKVFDSNKEEDKSLLCLLDVYLNICSSYIENYELELKNKKYQEDNKLYASAVKQTSHEKRTFIEKLSDGSIKKTIIERVEAYNPENGETVEIKHKEEFFEEKQQQ